VLGVVRTEEQGHFAHQHIRQVLDCVVIGAELPEVPLAKLAPAVRVMAKPGPQAALG
jgi:hypothetical protein